VSRLRLGWPHGPSWKLRPDGGTLFARVDALKGNGAFRYISLNTG
jgi:hypothetical protein